jgi:hypothetical protein
MNPSRDAHIAQATMSRRGKPPHSGCGEPFFHEAAPQVPWTQVIFMRNVFAGRRSRPVMRLGLAILASAAGLAACGDDSESGSGEHATDASDEGPEGGASQAGDSEAAIQRESRGATDAGENDVAIEKVTASVDGGDARDGATEIGLADAALDCGSVAVLHTPPAVPTSIAAPPGVVLLGGFYGSGTQYYLCEAVTSDGGADSGQGGSWVNAAIATLYGDNCAAVIAHSFSSGNPMWTAIADRSSVIGRRDGAYLQPGANGPVTSIPWLRLTAIINTGPGMLRDVTYIQRVDTMGGVGPAGSCDPNGTNTLVEVPYSATYYFYAGTPTHLTMDAARAPADADAQVDADWADTDSATNVPGMDAGADVSSDFADTGDAAPKEASSFESGADSVSSDATGEN